MVQLRGRGGRGCGTVGRGSRVELVELAELARVAGVWVRAVIKLANNPTLNNIGNGHKF